MGQEEDAWLEDDENLQMWENNELTTGDRRILIAQWYCKAYHKALESEAKRKYFEHAGAAAHRQPIALCVAHHIAHSPHIAVHPRRTADGGRNG